MQHVQPLYTCTLMRNGTKLKHLLTVCDINLTMEDGVIVVTTIHKGTGQSRSREGPTFSAALDKAYRQMLKDSTAHIED